MTFQPDQGAFPQVCPYLGLADDADSHATYSTEAHRCYKLPRPTKIALGHQDTYCLGENHVACPIFQGEGVPATQQPAAGAAGAGAAAAAGATAAAAPRPEPFATQGSQPAAPKPVQPVQQPSMSGTPSGTSPARKPSSSLGGPKKTRITMPMATVGLFAIALGVIALVLVVLNLTDDDGGDDLTPADILATSEAQTQQAGGDDETPDSTATTGSSVTSTPAPTATTSPGGGTEHVVVAGDTCSGIAEQYNITPEELVAANDMTLDDCPNLQVGDVLIIPPASG